MGNMHQEILVVRDLSVTFQTGREEVKAVDLISFTLKKGCTTGIVGESGSGKSVTALALMRLLPSSAVSITASEISLFDRNGISTDLLSLDERKMRQVRGNRIAMVFQEPMTSLNPVMRCGAQVSEAILAHRPVISQQARTRTLELFREVKLPDPENIFRAYPHELSGGQKQRVMIAMAVASGPDILIADEPTTALDVTVQKSILSLLKELQKKYGLTILFITHDLRLISGIADELLVMNNGKVVEAGLAGKIFSGPSHQYTRNLLACRPPLDTNLRRLPVIQDFNKPGLLLQTEDIYRLLLRDELQYQDRLKEMYKKEPVLITHQLSATFPGRANHSKAPFIAVNEVSLELYPGEVLGLVGESGCGKTTLGRTILRLKESSAGSIIFRNKNITAFSRKELKKLRKEMQIVFQDPFSSLNPMITIGSAIMEPMKIYGIGPDVASRREMAMELLEKTGLDRDHFYRYPHEFSGGQRQRICIARALSVKPKFIIFDESVSALDVSVQAQILNLLNDLREEFGFTCIFISHDLSVIKFISDRIAVMKDGRIIEEGAADSLFREPKSGYTAELINSYTNH